MCAGVCGFKYHSLTPFILCVLLYVVCFDDCCRACVIEWGLGWMVNSLGGENPAKFWFYACMTGIGLAVLMCIYAFYNHVWFHVVLFTGAHSGFLSG